MTSICSWCKSSLLLVRCLSTLSEWHINSLYVDDLYNKDVLMLRKIAQRCDRLKHTFASSCIQIRTFSADWTSFHALMNTRELGARVRWMDEAHTEQPQRRRREYFKEKHARCCRQDAASQKSEFCIHTYIYIYKRLPEQQTLGRVHIPRWTGAFFALYAIYIRFFPGRI